MKCKFHHFYFCQYVMPRHVPHSPKPGASNTFYLVSSQCCSVFTDSFANHCLSMTANLVGFTMTMPLALNPSEDVPTYLSPSRYLYYLFFHYYMTMPTAMPQGKCYFPSVWTEMKCYFPSVWMEIRCHNSLFSILENLLASLTFWPQKPSSFFYTYPTKNPSFKQINDQFIVTGICWVQLNQPMLDLAYLHTKSHLVQKILFITAMCSFSGCQQFAHKH